MVEARRRERASARRTYETLTIRKTSTSSIEARIDVEYAWILELDMMRSNVKVFDSQSIKSYHTKGLFCS